MDLEKALQLARERGLDLIQVTEKVEPPVCKIMDYGKYLYLEEKKRKEQKKIKAGQLKVIRLGFAISLHDLQTKADQAEKFLNQGQKIKLELILRGREKALANFAKEKINQFLEILKERVDFKIERELKREPKGFTLILVKV